MRALQGHVHALSRKNVDVKTTRDEDKVLRGPNATLGGAIVKLTHGLAVGEDSESDLKVDGFRPKATGPKLDMLGWPEAPFSG